MTDDTDKIDNEVCTDTYKPSDDFSAEIKKLRLKKNLTQEMFATALKVDVTSVRNWEHGKNFPHDCTCKKIISALSLTEEEQVLLFVIDNKSKICNADSLNGETDGAADCEVAVSDSAVFSSCHSERSDSEVKNLPSAAPKAKPLIVIFKEQWLKVRKPFVIGVLAWIVMWGVIALVCAIFTIYPINRYKGGEPADSVVRVDIDFRELIIPLILSFIATIILAIVVHFIIKKIIAKRRAKK